MTLELLIIFTNGEKKVVTDVSTFKYNNDLGMFIFEKNNYRSFLPKENIKFFGRKK